MGRDDAPELRVESLTKVFGRKVTAVSDLTFTARPGRVTGFLGPNGSGKTTTLRCLLGLVRPTSGRALVGTEPYGHLTKPLAHVGAALESSGFHPGRTGRDHLLAMAAGAQIASARVDEVLEGVGMAEAGRRRVGEYSLGMRQRLSLASALLADPGALVLDEPANGLDPEGIAWLRGFLRDRAARGGTVLVSSHLLAEAQQTVDDVVIIQRGRLVHAGSMDEMVRDRQQVMVRTPEVERLSDVIAKAGGSAALAPDGLITVDGLTATEVGHLAFVHGCEVHELAPGMGDLERAFLTLTAADAAQDGA